MLDNLASLILNVATRVLAKMLSTCNEVNFQLRSWQHFLPGLVVSRMGLGVTIWLHPLELHLFPNRLPPL